MSVPRRVLIVTASSDDRPSSDGLDSLMEALRRRPDVEPTCWFLRGPRGCAGRPGLNVDALRTWLPVRVLDAVGLRWVANVARGVRLRSWLRTVDPDLVVLDDALGYRVARSTKTRPVIAVRCNPDLPLDYELETPDRPPADLVVSIEPPEDPFADVPWLVEPFVALEPEEFAALPEPIVRTQIRRERWGVPTGAPVVVGWGDDGWLDGLDRFVRALWYLEHRHAVLAHGVWLGLPEDSRDVQRLEEEAARCGVADRYHLIEQDPVHERWLGDAVFLPGRYPPEAGELLAGGLADVPVVVFGGVDQPLPWVSEVAYLDIEGAASALADALRGIDRPGEIARRDWESTWSYERLAAHLVDSIDAARG